MLAWQAPSLHRAISVVVVVVFFAVAILLVLFLLVRVFVCLFFRQGHLMKSGRARTVSQAVVELTMFLPPFLSPGVMGMC